MDVGGFGRGSCELTDAPTSRLDLGRDFFPDRDYDFYERDRNGGPDCNVPSKGGLYGGSNPYGHYYGSGGTTNRYDSWGGGRRPSYGGGRGDSFIGSPSHGPWGTSGGGSLYGNGNYYGGSGSSWGSYGSGGGYYGGGGGSHGSSGSWGGGWHGGGSPPPGRQNSRGGQGSRYWNRPPVGWNGNREVGFHGHGSAPPFGYREGEIFQKYCTFYFIAAILETNLGSLFTELNTFVYNAIIMLPVSNRKLDSVDPCFIILRYKNGTKTVVVFRRSVNMQTHTKWRSHGSIQFYSKMLFAFLIGTLINHELCNASQNSLLYWY